MKKKISILAAVFLVLGLTACGNNGSQASNDTTQTIQAESSQETETANDSQEVINQTETSDTASNTPDVAAEDTSSHTGCGCGRYVFGRS